MKKNRKKRKNKAMVNNVADAMTYERRQKALTKAVDKKDQVIAFVGVISSCCYLTNCFVSNPMRKKSMCFVSHMENTLVLFGLSVVVPLNCLR